MDLIIFINDDIDNMILEKEIKETFGKITNKVNIEKLSSSKQKLLANFMKDDSDDES